MHDGEMDTGDEVRAWLAANWRAVLGGDVEPDGDFFAAGGNSLRAAKLAARIRKAGYRDVSLADLIEHRLFAAQVELLAGKQRGQGGPAEVRRPAAGLTSAQQRNRLEMARERLLAGETPPPLSIQLVVALHGPVDVAALDTAARALVARHAALRTRFFGPGGDIEPTECEVPDDWHVTVHDLTDVDADEGWRQAREISQAQNRVVIDFARPPLVVISLSVLRDNRSLLVITVDHLVADGISMGVMWRDLDELYDAAVAGRAADLPPLRVTAQQVLAERETAWRADETRVLAAWDEVLAGYEQPPLCDLVPPDLLEEFRAPQPADHHRWELPGEVARGFAAACLTVEVTEHSAVIGLVFQALRLLDGREDAVLCTAQSGRFSEDEEDLVGWLSEQVIVRLGPDPAATGPRLLDVARHAQERLRFAYRHGVPYHVLVRRFQGMVGGRSPRKPCIFVNYSDSPMIGPRLGAARTENIVDRIPLTSFAGPGVLVERETDRLVIDLSVVRDRYPQGVAERFGELLRDAFTAFAADPYSLGGLAGPAEVSGVGRSSR